MHVLAFIPARGGSKGIPRKNLVPLAGKPLIQYTVEAAQKAASVSEIFLSSDDAEIIAFCRSLGLAVPYLRPAELSSDTATMIDAVLHGLAWRREQGMPDTDAVLLLQPTSPLRTAADIDGAVDLLSARGTQSLVSVHEMAEHPFECIKGLEPGWNFLDHPGQAATRRQDYGQHFFFMNGAIYIVRTAFLETARIFFEEGRSALYVMPRARGVDIDDLEGLRLAEFYCGGDVPGNERTYERWGDS